MKKKKKIWKKLIFFFIVFSLFSSSFIIYTTKPKYRFENDYGENSFIKTSDNEISIITPENKTYAKPMSGYYPATYGFENDENGVIPEEWSFFTSYTGFAQVVEEMDGHNKVVELKDAGGGGGATIVSNTFSSQITGIIECYIYLDYPHNSGDYLMIQIHDQAPIDTIVIYWENGNLIVYDGTTPTTVGSYDAYTWYHVRIQFDCADDWHLWIDENSVDGGSGYEFRRTTTTSITKFDMRTWSDNVFNYLDAVCYSWDPNYNIGTNLDQGLLLNFDNYPSLDWMGYSLDGLANKTILGNTTLPLPTNGAHNIQVFGNDSLGTMYASNLRHFTLDLPMISITTPENKTYTEPMSGYYPATYGFESDINGVEPNGWLRWDPGIGNVRVISEKDGHKKVLEVDDDAVSTGDDPGIYQLFSEDHNSGTIELWVYKESGNCPIWISLLDTSLTRYVTGLAIDSYVSQYNNNRFNINSAPDGWQTFGPTFYDDQWYHISISWNGTTKTVDVYINGILEADDYSYTHTDAVDADRLEIRSAWGTTGLFYIDAIGFSWHPNYNIGDNFNEGLLLSFTNRTTIDWLGYSLNGLTNKTILGDVTIPFLGDGTHFIQVFGNDTLGTKYQSEIRYFSINAPPPSINIITPSSDDFYSIIAPSFSISITAFNQIISWYTLDDGGTNITFTGSSGTINQTEWDEEGEGPITIRFYANDSFGRLNYAEITINKDITDPVIIINSPLFGDQFTTIPPRFNISVDELNIDAMWYTIDGGLTNYGIAEYSGYIDSTAWNSAPNGAVTIRFYVRDKAGNIDYEDVVVQKNVQPYIPPDNNFIIIISVAIGALLIFVGVILILYIILSRKRKYEPYKFKEPRKPEIRVKPKYGYLICPYCHNENLVKNNYCIYCGASLIEFKPDNM